MGTQFHTPLLQVHVFEAPHQSGFLYVQLAPFVVHAAPDPGSLAGQSVPTEPPQAAATTAMTPTAETKRKAVRMHRAYTASRWSSPPRTICTRTRTQRLGVC